MNSNVSDTVSCIKKARANRLLEQLRCCKVSLFAELVHFLSSAGWRTLTCCIWFLVADSLSSIFHQPIPDSRVYLSILNKSWVPREFSVITKSRPDSKDLSICMCIHFRSRYASLFMSKDQYARVAAGALDMWEESNQENFSVKIFWKEKWRFQAFRWERDLIKLLWMKN